MNTHQALALARQQHPGRAAPPDPRPALLARLNAASAAIVKRDRRRHMRALAFQQAEQACARCRRELDRADDTGEREEIAIELERLTAARDLAAARLPRGSSLPRPLVLALRAYSSYRLGRREYDGEVQQALRVLLHPDSVELVEAEAGRE